MSGSVSESTVPQSTTGGLVQKWTGCGATLTDENWWPSRQRQAIRVCAKCQHERNKPSTRKWQLSHRKNLTHETIRLARRLRSEAIQLLGGICQLCGTMEYLEFCHITYKSAKHTGPIYVANEVFKDPDNFLLLCRECHHHPEKYLKQLINERKEAEA